MIHLEVTSILAFSHGEDATMTSKSLLHVLKEVQRIVSEARLSNTHVNF